MTEPNDNEVVYLEQSSTDGPMAEQGDPPRARRPRKGNSTSGATDYAAAVNRALQPLSVSQRALALSMADGVLGASGELEAFAFVVQLTAAAGNIGAAQTVGAAVLAMLDAAQRTDATVVAIVNATLAAQLPAKG